MSKKLAFGWVLHQHQPVGNFPWVFEQVYESCYAPLLAALERHAGVRVTMHFSGPLLDWLLAKQPGYIERLAAMVRRGQVEMLTGGYYEPILPILPASDQQGQITKMTTAIQQHFATTPTGLWLTERVWEPNLPSALTQAGVGYTIVDDTHFLMAGLTPDQLYGYYLTEDQGHPLVLFPNPKVMREVIPFKSLTRIRAEFQALAVAQVDTIHQPIVVMADDGEKFGSWPGTYDRLWRRGFMERFLGFLEDNTDWLETVHLGEYRQREAPLGRVYLPTASYVEMMEWALPAKRSASFERIRHGLAIDKRTDVLNFLRGSSWRSFFSKYPEANNFHKKMLRVHNKIAQCAERLTPDQHAAALDQLWQGQCNCGYWHGLFGGVYLADIRSAIYQHLIRAEVIADGAQSNPIPTVTVTDFDCDGRDEILIEGPLMDVYLAPHDGGSIFEWDYKLRPFNVIDTLARRTEAYHHKLLHFQVKIVPPVDAMAPSEFPADLDLEESLDETSLTTSIHDLIQAKEAGLERLLHYDALRRNLLRERFFAPDTTFTAFAATETPELGDFADGVFTHHIEHLGSEVQITLVRDGTVQTPVGLAPLHLSKRIRLATDAAAIEVEYRLHNSGDLPIDVRFGIEGSWGLLGGGHNPLAWYEINGAKSAEDAALDVAGTTTDIQCVALVNSGVGVRVTLIPGEHADLWRFPIETVANSEAGFERSYQCSATLLHWPLHLAPGDYWGASLRMEVAGLG